MTPEEILSKIVNREPVVVTMRDACALVTYEGRTTHILNMLILYNRLDCLVRLASEDPELFIAVLNPSKALELLIKTMMSGGIRIEDRQDLIKFLLKHGASMEMLLSVIAEKIEFSEEATQYKDLICFLVEHGMEVPPDFYTSSEELRKILEECPSPTLKTVYIEPSDCVASPDPNAGHHESLAGSLHETTLHKATLA